jgi:hypothetical protein
LKIIRGRLTPQQLIPPSTRYDADCDCIQTTTDGGSTWTETVGADPRHQPAYLKPPVAGSSKQCDSAANMVKWIHDYMDDIIAQLAAGAQAIYLANSLVHFLEQCFPFAAYFIELVFETAVDLFGLGAATLNTAFDSTTYDLLLCIFYLRIDSDGRVSAAALTLIETDIVSQINATAAAVLAEILFIQGEVGLSNAGASGSQTGACGDCVATWIYQWDFTISDGDFDFVDTQAGDTGANGHYDAGAGWAGDYTGHSDGYGFVYCCARKTADITWPTGSTITDIGLEIVGSDCHHTEAWVGDNRTAGLGADVHIYDGGGAGAHTDSGSYAPSGTVHVCFANNNEGSTLVTVLNITGTGDRPAFTGGAFL